MTMPDFPVSFYAVTTAAILITGIAKGGFGQGSGGIAVPLMSIFIAPPEAAGIMLPILCAMDIFGVHAYRHSWSHKHIAILLPGALLGIGLGALAFGSLPVNVIRAMLGVISVTFAVNQWLRLTERIARGLASAKGPPGRVAGTLWGAASGFTSTLAHAGGPPFAIYILAQKIDKTLLVGTSAVFFCIINYVKLVPYYFLGQLNVGNLTAALIFAPLAPLGVWLGVWLHRRISHRMFFNLSYGLLLLTGLKLLYDAATR
ncbi:MAG: sulfite exporter TauE/SafE family protein [Betaproteobacteria bacterium]